MKVIAYNYYNNAVNNFTGIIIDPDFDILFFKNGNFHNENGPSIFHYEGYCWYYKGEFYGNDNEFTIKSWKKKVKELKYLESLDVFK